LILNSGKCAWGKCIFCGYGRIEGMKPGYENLKLIFDNFFNKLFRKKFNQKIKVFGSGSFLDDSQVPQKARRYFIEKCRVYGVEKLTVESRPEFITREKLDEFKGIDLSVAIGLEAADDMVLDMIKKGFHLRDFEAAAEIIHGSGFKVRTYLLVNAPGADVNELSKSLDYALKYSDSVVLINLLPHGNTPLFKLWLNGEWNFLSKEEFFEICDNALKNLDDKVKERVELDPETFKFVPKFPEELRAPLKGVGEEYLTHPHFEVWQDYLCRWYRPRDKDTLLFLPCSYKKPYSESKTYRQITEKLREIKFDLHGAHRVFISNPGVIPIEFENYYPFNAYDWDEKNEMDEIKGRYIEVTKNRIVNYLGAHKTRYGRIRCCLKPESESWKALKAACDELEIDIENYYFKIKF